MLYMINAVANMENSVGDKLIIDTNTSAEAIVSDTNIDIPIEEDIHVIIDSRNNTIATVNVCNTNEGVPIGSRYGA